MKVLILTVGSRGDVQPYTALGVGLREAGHDVTLATHVPFREFVATHGLDFAPLPGDPREVLQTDEAQELLASGRSVVRFAGRFLAVLKPWFRELVASTSSLVPESDLVLYSPLAFTAWHQAQVTGTPALLATLQPFARTRAFSTVSNGGADLGGPLNLISHRMTEQLFWQPLREEVNAWRVEDLGLDPIPFLGPYKRLSLEGRIQLAGLSPTLVPPPDDWPGTIRVTGAWHLDQPEPHDAALEAFLDAGEPPVYVGFGSMVARNPEMISELVVTAARLGGRRLVLGSGWTGLGADLGDDVHVVGDTPHQHLFPRMAAVVHHGGAGTTHTAARAGIPQVVIPFFADQPFWARRVNAVGIGPAPLPRSRLAVGSLAERIGSAVAPGHSARARALSRILADEHGVEAAVAVIETHVG